MILKDIWMDVKAVQERDPAARNAWRYYFYIRAYMPDLAPGGALVYEHHMFFIARLISQVARFFT